MRNDASGHDRDRWVLTPAPRYRFQRRGIRALATLLFLFTFALGQAALIAIADEDGDEPTTSDAEAPANGSETTTTEEPADEGAVEEDVPSDDGATVEDGSTEATDEPAEDTTSEGTTGTSAASSSADPAPAADEGSGASHTAEVAADTPGPPSGDGVQPVVVLSNPDCSDVMLASDFLFEHKTGVPQDATINLTFDGLSGTLTISVNESAQTFDFSFTGDFVAAGVIVKGGSNANFYDYRPDGNAADTSLHAPVNPSNGKFYGLSHISFCIDEETRVPGIDVTKSCPESVPFGEDIEYTITVQNTGNEALVDVVVTDTLLGDITADFDVDLSAGLAVGATATAVVTYSPGADEDPVTNTVTAEAVGEDSAVEASDSASCETDVLPPSSPAIQIVKGGPSLVHRGDTITYQFEVTNIGGVELFDLELSDPRCDPGTIVEGADVDASLAVDEVWHFTCTHLVTDADPDPIPNTATVRGDTQAGEGGQEVTDQDDHVVDIIHPAISIEKTVSDSSVVVGTTVTYTFVVTNTGDTTLFDISVDDDRLGHIGDIASLDPGESASLTATFTVGNSPIVNVGTATGEDILETTVTDSDDAEVTPLAGTGGGIPPGEGPPDAGGAGGGTAFTGSELWTWALLAAALALIGVTALVVARREREVDDPAG